MLACDTSDYGVGAVLSQVIDGGKERPIAYISRTLSAAEKHYSHQEKKAPAIILAVKKFHLYFISRHFTIESDHQPAVILSAYRYSIQYKSGKQLKNVDALSRLPRPVSTSNDCVPADVVAVVDHLSSLAVNAQAIKEWTAKDSVLSCIHRFTLSGWPTHKLPSKFQPYVSRKDELSILDGCILWPSCVIVPPQGQQPFVGRAPQYSSGCKQDESSGPFLYLVAWNGHRD